MTKVRRKRQLLKTNTVTLPQQSELRIQDQNSSSQMQNDQITFAPDGNLPSDAK